jgi:hypothetical protein
MRGERDGQRRAFRCTVLTVRSLLVAVMVAGCSGGQPIRNWVVDVDGGPHDMHVTLPSMFPLRLGWHDVDFTMRTSVALSPAQRGQTLTLAFECYHGPLAVTANGTAVDDIGDTAVGEHRYVIPPVSGDTLEVVAAGHVDLRASILGVNGPARLVVGARTQPSATAVFTRYQLITSIATSILIGILFALLFALDRRRRADAAYAVQSFTSLALPLFNLSLIPAFVSGELLVVLWIAAIYCIHYEFELDRPPRSLLLAFASVALVGLGVTWSYAFGRATYMLLSLAIMWTYVHLIRALVRSARGARRADAMFLIVALATSFVFNVFGLLNQAEIHVFEELHIYSAGGTIWLFAQLFVLARRHVASRRETERANVELQRQVAERSKDLADALGKLAQQSDALAAEHVIDGRYRVLRKLGAGGMGVVYEVERLADRKRLAIKTVRGKTDAKALARLAREAQVAAEHRHPNLMPVIDVGVADGGLFLAMPLVEGGSLEQQRARFGDGAWATPLLAQIAAGLAALHARGIVHRDLKPGNVLLDGDVPRIADFGLASLAERSSDAPHGTDSTVTAALGKVALTRAGDIFGTPAYMAPELASGVGDAQPSSDIFAFGLVAHEMIFGSSAFSEPPLLARLAGREIVVPACEPPIVARCLALDPAARPTAAELAAALA